VIVVADTTPLNYLLRMGLISLLENLYGHVYLPKAVADEIRHPRAPAEVRFWANNLPAWVTVAEAQKTVDVDLLGLDLGEREAIVLVSQLNAELLLVDDMPARVAAERRGIQIAGTLGILRDSANAGRIGFEEKLAELLQLGFRTTPIVLKQIRAGLT
jgi:predicted nucleic acid-binding protein